MMTDIGNERDRHPDHERHGDRMEPKRDRDHHDRDHIREREDNQSRRDRDDNQRYLIACSLFRVIE